MLDISSWIITYIEVEKKSQGAGGWLILQGEGARVTQRRLSPHLWGTVAGRLNADKASNEPGPASAQRLQPGAKGDVARNRAGDKAITWVQSPSRSQVQRQDFRQAAAHVQGARQGNELPTAQLSRPSRRLDQRHPHTYSVAQAGTEGSEVS